MVGMVSVSLTEVNNQNFQGVTPRSPIFSPPGSLQNQIQLLLVLQKIKVLPEGGQRLDIDQDWVLICRRIGYRAL